MASRRRSSGSHPVRSTTAFRIPVALAALLISAVLIAACGSGDDSTDSSDARSAETESPAGETAVEETVSEGEATENSESGSKNNGGTKDQSQAGSKNKGGSKDGSTGGGTPDESDSSELDSKENDIPPESGTPEDAFEKFCDENPEACS